MKYIHIGIWEFGLVVYKYKYNQPDQNLHVPYN